MSDDGAPRRGRPRQRWRAARSHLTPVADGGTAIAGTPELTFRTAPLPADVPLKLWEECGCDYPAPAGPKSHDPAWAEWTEEPPRTEGAKKSLRWALTRAPGRNHPGGLLGPNFYALGHFHSGDARREQPGFPDLLIWSPWSIPNEVWELKKMDENPSLPQAHHMTSLEASGFVVRTVRPCCLLSGWVDRWLARLAGVDPTLSEWAPELTEQERHHAKVRAARAAIAGGAQLPAAAAAPAARRPALFAVPEDPPGQPVPAVLPDVPEATAYLIPMPGGAGDDARRTIEAWLRDAGFPAVAVPWPMRIAVCGRLVVVWVNTGGLAPAGQPRPRAWRTAYLDRPFPEAAAAELGGRGRRAESLPAAMALIEAEAPAPHLPEETR